MAKIKFGPDSDIVKLTGLVAHLNGHLSKLSKKGIDVELDFVSDDDSDADLIDLISIKQRVWEPELED